MADERRDRILEALEKPASLPPIVIVTKRVPEVSESGADLTSFLARMEEERTE